MTAQESSRRQPTSAKRAMDPEGLHGIGGTAGFVPARRRENRRKQTPVHLDGSDQDHHDQIRPWSRVRLHACLDSLGDRGACPDEAETFPSIQLEDLALKLSTRASRGIGVGDQEHVHTGQRPSLQQAPLGFSQDPFGPIPLYCVAHFTTGDDGEPMLWKSGGEVYKHDQRGPCDPPGLTQSSEVLLASQDRHVPGNSGSWIRQPRSAVGPSPGADSEPSARWRCSSADEIHASSGAGGCEVEMSASYPSSHLDPTGGLTPPADRKPGDRKAEVTRIRDVRSTRNSRDESAVVAPTLEIWVSGGWSGSSSPRTCLWAMSYDNSTDFDFPVVCLVGRVLASATLSDPSSAVDK